MRRFTFLAVLAVLSHWQAGFAQSIKIDPEAPKVGEPIVARLVDLPAVIAPSTQTIVWKADGAKFRQANDAMLYVWGKAGAAKLIAEITTDTKRMYRGLEPGPNWEKDKSDVKVVDRVEFVERAEKTVVVAFKIVGDGPKPPPGPDPPGPVPPLPDPVPGTLGALVPAEARLPLAEFYGDLAIAVRSEMFATLGVFRTKHIESVKFYQAAGKLPSVAAINEPINAKLVAAVGLDDAPLDPTKRAALAAALESIATEFRGS